MARHLTGRRRTPAALALAFLALPSLPAAGWAQASGGEELYMDVLGCWTCHGRTSSGAGGEGEPLQGTFLPLSLFVKELRLPAETMPPFSPLIATDEELAIVYAWLEGADPVVAPPLVHLTLEAAGEGTAGAAVELELVAVVARAEGEHEPSGVRYRVTLFQRDNALVADLPLRFGSDEAGWTELTTDSYGQAVLGPDEGIPLSELAGPRGAKSRLRLSLPAGSYALTVEAVAADGSADPAILGIGSAVFNPS